MQNLCDVLIKDAIGVVIPNVGIVQTNILIEDGKIKCLKKSIDNIQATREINAAGKYVLPGIIDPHVHYGVYSPIEKAARTESRSAAIGGVTTMIRMLRLYETYQNITNHIKASKDTHYIDYSIHASILRPHQLKDMRFLKEKVGINSFKIYMNLGADVNKILMDLEPGSLDVKEREINVNDELVRSVIKEAVKIGSSIVLVHAEDPVLCSRYTREAKDKIHNGFLSTRPYQDPIGKKIDKKVLQIWSDCRPSISEAQSIANITKYAKRLGASLYFVHIGSSLALDTIMSEKVKGRCNFYIETCPHYLTHTTDFNDLRAKVVPPIRSKSDVQSMWSALQNGIIDTIGTDHVANRLSNKLGEGDLWSALSGFPGIATMLPVLLSEGVNQGRIGLQRLSEVTSYNTARIFSLYPRKGSIATGSDADLTLVDLDLERKISPELLQSYSDYTIYDGVKLSGWPVLTMVRGQVVMENGQIDDSSLGHGEFISRPVAAARL